MAVERNAFTSLCLLASRERWCWKLSCTTCGHMHFRYGFHELSQGRDPELQGWLTKGHLNNFTRSLGGLMSVTRSIQRSKRLHEILSEASLKEIAAQCLFPDYLGYFGLGLHYTRQLELQHRLLTPLWGQQLLDMIEESSPEAVMLRERISGTAPLIWNDIDGLEYAMKHEFRAQQAH